MKRILLIIFILINLNIWALEVAAPKAPPSIPLLTMEGIDLTLYEDVSTQGVPAIIRRKGEIYILPVNLGASLYKRGAKIRLVGVTSDGLLSLVSSEIDTFRGLQGRTLYIGGQGASPDVITRSLLAQEGIDSRITYRSSPEIAKLMITGRVANAILPEPLATMVLTKNPDVRRVADLKDIWPGKAIPQVGIFVMEATLETKKDQIDRFLEDYVSSLGSFSDTEVDRALEEFGLSMDRDAFRSSLKHMNLTLKKERENVERYLKTLGIEVEDGFYGW